MINQAMVKYPLLVLGVGLSDGRCYSFVSTLTPSPVLKDRLYLVVSSWLSNFLCSHSFLLLIVVLPVSSSQGRGSFQTYAPVCKPVSSSSVQQQRQVCHSDAKLAAGGGLAGSNHHML